MSQISWQMCDIFEVSNCIRDSLKFYSPFPTQPSQGSILTLIIWWGLERLFNFIVVLRARGGAFRRRTSLWRWWAGSRNSFRFLISLGPQAFTVYSTPVPLLPDLFFNLCGMFITIHISWLLRDFSVPFGSACFSHLSRLLMSIRGGRPWRLLLFGCLRAIVVLLSFLFPLVVLRGSWSRFWWLMWGFITIIIILVLRMGTLAILASPTGPRSGFQHRCLQPCILSNSLACWASREELFIKGCLCCREDYVIRAAHEAPSFPPRVSSEVCHHLGLWCELIISYFCRNINISSTPKHPEVVYRGLVPFQSLVGGLPIKAMHRGPIVNMSGVIKGRLPPGLREASLKSHGFCLFPEHSNESFCVTILLVHVGDTL